jgi:hypothetical protein
VPQNRYALCGFYVVLWDRKSGAEFFYSDTALILLLVCFSSIAFLHRLAGLLLLRLSPQTFCSLRSCVLLLCVGDLLGMALPFLTPHLKTTLSRL